MKSIRIASLCLGTLLALAAPAAAERTSVRIMALGGDYVAGVIPDPYTDLHLSPVHALDAAAATLWYARRDTPYLGFRSGLPAMDVTLAGGGTGVSSGPSNEIALHGARLGDWRIAFTALWSFNKDYIDDASAAINASYDYTITSEARFKDSDADSWLLDVAAARPVGGELAWGVRLRASGCYDHLDIANKRTNYYYEALSFETLTRYFDYTTITNYLSRRVAFDAQCALARTRDGRPVEEIAVTVSLHRIARLEQLYDVDTEARFDSYGDLSNYLRRRASESDSREGDLWGVEAAYRRAYPDGLRIYAGGSFGIVTYDAASSAGTENYYWNFTPNDDDRLDASLAGDGSVTYGTLFAKAARVHALHRTLDIHVTLLGAFALSRSEEDPLVGYMCREDDETIFSTEAIVSYSGAETRASLVVPLSIDFHPSSYFSYFAAFSPYARWSRLMTENPALGVFVFEPPAASRVPGGPAAAPLSPGQIDDPFAPVETREESFDTGYSLSCGFSLRYGDRFAVEVFTGSNIVPDYWQGLYTNIRYGF